MERIRNGCEIRYYNGFSKEDEDILEPELPIIDPHHHLWDKNDHHHVHKATFLTKYWKIPISHNIVATVFIECGAMFKKKEQSTRAVGETEFVNGIAAMSDLVIMVKLV